MGLPLSSGTDRPSATHLPRWAQPNFNTSVHGARGLFAAAVFVFHVVNSGLATWSPLESGVPLFLLRLSEYGVELFFGISGYVIASTLRRAASPTVFLEDRAIRIYPVLVASTLVITVLALVTGFHGYEDLTIARLVWLLPACLLALPGVFPLPALHPAAWSLSYELTFYIACAMGWILRRGGFGWTSTLLVLAAFAMFAFYPRGLPLVAGMLVAEGYLDRPSMMTFIRHPVPWLLLFLVLWGCIAELGAPKHIIATTMFQWATDWRLPLAVLAFSAVTFGFAGLVGGYGLLGQLLRMPAMQYLGTISYSFYLWHPIVMAGVKAGLVRSGLKAWSGDGAQLLFLILSLPPALVVSDVSQRLLERRAGIWLRRRLHHATPLVIKPRLLREP